MIFHCSLRIAIRPMFSALAAVVMLAYSMPALAVSADPNALIEGAKQCTQYLPRHERQYGIPEHLLAAIASTESGRFHPGLGLNLPWPWTINVNGRGYFFDTKAEAVAAVNKLRSEGYQSIDVGCMQVNLHHHPHAFASVEQAFDPAYNVGYAASFLKTNFMEEGSWRKATADYHSRTPMYGSSYAEQVFGTWGRIVAKVADARAGKPILNDYAKNRTFQTDGKPVVMASRVVRPSSYHPPHMHMISIGAHDSASTRENGVLVIRPRHDDSEIVVSMNNQDSAMLAKPSNAVTATRASASDMEIFNKSSASSSPSNVKVVNVASKTGGQFDPKAHAASINALADPQPAAPKTTGNKLFVFDN